MKGTLEEESAKGNLDKYQTLKSLHDFYKPNLYLEIGVQKGRSLDLASCKAIGVDPYPRTVAKKNQEIYGITSDDFFASFDIELPDLVFIDGLHLFEQALKDFINVEYISHKDTVIVIDDIFPSHPSQSLRNRCTTKWTGDVWKVYEILKEYRPDLNIEPLDVSPTGIIVVTNLDPKNTVLSINYEEIVKKYMPLAVPKSILNRDDLCK